MYEYGTSGRFVSALLSPLADLETAGILYIHSTAKSKIEKRCARFAQRLKAVSYTHLDVYKRQVLANMGHGDEIIIADGNFPADSSTDRLIRCDGHGVPEVLEACLLYTSLPLCLGHKKALFESVSNSACMLK